MMSGECTWRVHPGNIPTLYQTCLSAVQNHDRIMDAILLQGEMIGLPPEIIGDILGESDSGGIEGNERCDGEGDADKGMEFHSGYLKSTASDPPRATGEPSRSCPCRDGRCSEGFFPTSAVFLDKRTAVLLDGASGCLKRCVVTFKGSDQDDESDLDEIKWPQNLIHQTSSSSESFQFSQIETIPEAFHRRYGGQGNGSDQFVLRNDGAALGVVSGTLCVYPLELQYGRRQIELIFRGTKKYDSILLARGGGGQMVFNGTSPTYLYAIGVRARPAATDAPFDLLRISFAPGQDSVGPGRAYPVGEIIGIDKSSCGKGNGIASSIPTGPPKRSGKDESNLPAGLRPESLLVLSHSGDMMVLGYLKGPNRDTCLYRGRIWEDHRGAPTVEWTKEDVVAEIGNSADLGISLPIFIHAKYHRVHNINHLVGGKGGSSLPGTSIFASYDNGRTWHRSGSFGRDMTGGRDGSTPVMACSLERVFAFAYEGEGCRMAETERIIRTRKPSIGWPPLRVYEWK